MNRHSFRFAAVLVFLLALAPLWGRDWAKDPPMVEIPFAERVAVVGDLHGAFPQFAATLKALQVALPDAKNPFKLNWCGADTVLIFTGDYCDRGEYTREVVEAIMDLEVQAPKTGGRVIPLFGNHEALLLNGQVLKWAQTLKPPKQKHYQNTVDSLAKSGVSFQEAISPKGWYGSWVRRRPLFALVNGYLFVHGGLAKPPITRSELAADFRDDLEAENFNAGIFMNQSGPLWNREWWNEKQFVTKALQVFGARGVVFGHTVGALGTEGKINFSEPDMIGLDVGMTPAYGCSNGGGLLITITRNGSMLFRARYPDQPETLLFQVPAPVATSSSRRAAGGR